MLVVSSSSVYGWREALMRSPSEASWWSMCALLLCTWRACANRSGLEKMSKATRIHTTSQSWSRWCGISDEHVKDLFRKLELPLPPTSQLDLKAASLKHGILAEVVTTNISHSGFPYTLLFHAHQCTAVFVQVIKARDDFSIFFVGRLESPCLSL